MRQIYFAAPMHDDADQVANAIIIAALRGAGFRVYSPQEHGKWEDLVNKYGGEHNTRQYLYKMDLFAMQRADCCVAFCARDRGPSEGMLWEMGYMVGANKPVFLLNPNLHGYNIMPEFGSVMFKDVEKLIEHLKEEDFV